MTGTLKSFNNIQNGNTNLNKQIKYISYGVNNMKAVMSKYLYRIVLDHWLDAQPGISLFTL